MGSMQCRRFGEPIGQHPAQDLSLSQQPAMKIQSGGFRANAREFIGATRHAKLKIQQHIKFLFGSRRHCACNRTNPATAVPPNEVGEKPKRGSVFPGIRSRQSIRADARG